MVAAFAGDSQVEITWLPANTGGAATSFKIYRGTTSAFTPADPPLHTATTSESAYTDTDVTNASDYYYVVVAANAQGSSSPSAPASATPMAGLPGIPANLVATGSDVLVSLAWAAPPGGGAPAGYHLYRAQQTSDLVVTGGLLDTTPADTSTFADASVTNFSAYYYAVRAFNAVGDGPISNVVSATPSDGAPGMPQGPAASAGDRSVDLTWSAPSDGTVSTYRIYRGDAAGFAPAEPALAEVSGDSAAFTDGSVSNFQQYYYRIQAVNPAGTGTFSKEVTAYPNNGIPGQPLALASSAADHQVTLTWSAPSGGGTPFSYRVYRSDTSSVDTNGTPIGTTSGGTTFTDASGLQNFQTYYYAVVAENPLGSGAPSAAISEMPGLVPGAPINLTASTGLAPVTLRWSAAADGVQVDTYTLYRCDTPGASLDTCRSFKDLTDTAVSDSEPQSYQAYYYRVLGTNPKGTGTASTELFVYPKDGTQPIPSDPPPDTGQATTDHAGRSIAVSGAYALVGAPMADDASTATANAGAAYLYGRADDGSWRLAQTLTRPAGTDDPVVALAQFGHSVAIDGDIAAVGAPFDPYPPPALTPTDPTDGNTYTPFHNLGRVYIYTRQSDGSWQQEETPIGQLVKDSLNVQDQFGYSVAVSGNYLIVGARKKYIGGFLCGTQTGSAVIYDHSGGTWDVWQAVRPIDSCPGGSSANEMTNEEYGFSVAISGENAMVGAPLENWLAGGMTAVGSVHFFTHDSATGAWNHPATNPKFRNTAPGKLGWSVAMSGSLALAGAPFEDCPGATAACDKAIAGAGVVVAYQYDGQAWNQIGQIWSPGMAANENFGQSVTISGTHALIAAGTLGANPVVRNVYPCDFADGAWTCSAAQTALTTTNDAVQLVTPQIRLPGTTPYYGYALSLDGVTEGVGIPFADVDAKANDNSGDFVIY